jgi:signal transduction histidine kinase
MTEKSHPRRGAAGGADLEQLLEPKQLMARLERLEKEHASIEARLATSREHEAISVLARAIAHDMNNILASIMGLASIMKLDSDLNGQNVEDLEAMVDACVRGRELTQGLLGLARSTPRRRLPVSLNPLIRDETDRLIEEAAPKAQIHVALFDGDSRILGDEDQLRQALRNILINSVEATGGGDRLDIETTEVMLTGGDLAGYPNLEPGRYVRVTISDNGVGMDTEALKRACKPFFSTKADQGTGLGLAFVYGVVRAHAGRLTIESEAGVGTTVTIDLARQSAPAEARPPA